MRWQLPFTDAAFDAVVCQFGVMFFPDRAKAFAEARRVLRPGGVFLFNAWDRIEENEFADTVTRGAGHACSRTIRRASWRARRTAITTGRDRSATSRPAASRRAPAIDDRRRAQPRAVAAPSGARVLPGNAAAQRDRGARRAAPRQATDVAAEAVARPFGRGAVDGKIQAHVVAIER